MTETTSSGAPGSRPPGTPPPGAGADSDQLFPSPKRRYQSTQLMNLLLRPVMAPLIRLLAGVGLRGDIASLLGIVGYLGGAASFIAGTPPQRTTGLIIFVAGMLAELIDGGLARLRGPSPIGHYLAKVLESFYIVLLAPALAIGMFRNGDCGLALLLLGVFGASAHLQFRAAIELITTSHPAEELAALADRETGSLKRYLFAQFLPDHPSLAFRHRLTRILRENIMESSGIQPLILVAAVLAGRPEYFVLYYGVVHLGAWLAMVGMKMLLLKRGGGRLL